MRVARGLVEEQVLHDHAFHRLEARRDVLRVGIGLGDVLALHVEALERAVDRLVDHVGDAQARLVAERHAPQASRTSRASRRRRRGDSRRTRAGTSPCRRSPARCSGRAAGSRRRRRGRCCRSPSRDWRSPSPWSSPGVLGDAEAVVDRARCRRSRRAARRRAARRRATPVAAAVASGEWRSSAMKRAQDSKLAGVAALAHEGLVDQALGDDHMRERVDDGDVGAGPQRQVIVGLDMRRFARGRCGADRRRSACAPARRRFFMREANTGCASVGLAPMTMITSALSTDLKSCVPAEVPKVLRQAVAGRRMADARAGVDVVVAEAGAHQLLDEVHLLVGAARGGDGADRVAAVLRLDALEFARRVADRLVPRDLAPRDRSIAARIIGLMMRSLCVA